MTPSTSSGHSRPGRVGCAQRPAGTSGRSWKPKRRGDVADAVVAVAEVVETVRRSRVGTCGTGCVSIERIDDALVQRVVVLDVRAQRQRRRLVAAVEEHGGARARAGPAAPCSRSSLDERLQRPSSARGCSVTIRRPRCQVDQHGEDADRRRASGSQPPLRILVRLAPRNARSTMPKNDGRRARPATRGLRQLRARDDEEQHRGDRDRAR